MIYLPLYVQIQCQQNKQTCFPRHAFVNMLSKTYWKYCSIYQVVTNYYMKCSNYCYLSRYIGFQLYTELNLNWLLLHTAFFLLNNRHT